MTTISTMGSKTAASKREGGKEGKRNRDLLWRLVKLGKRLTVVVTW